MPIQAWGHLSIGTLAPSEAPMAVGSLWADTTANLLKRCSSTSPYTWVSVEGGGTGAPTDATYVTISTNATLTAERVLTAGPGVRLVDGGANGNATLTTTFHRMLLLMGG